jgi:hypothetical protein
LTRVAQANDIFARAELMGGRGMTTRRQVLCFASAQAVGRTALRLVPPSLALLTPRQGHAWVQTALAVASVVSSMIAANNRSDGGLSAVLSANLTYNRAAFKQLLEINDTLQGLVNDVKNIPDETIKRYRLERLAEVQAQIGAGLQQYLDLLSASKDFGDYASWARNPNTRHELGAISNAMNSALYTLEVRHQLDSMTALYLPLAAHVELAVRVALGESRGQMTARAARHMRLLMKASSDSEIGSAASQLVELNKGYAKVRADLLALGYEIPGEGREVVSRALLSRPGVQDYTSPPIKYRIEHCARVRSDGMSVGCTYENVYGPERVGATERFSISTEVKQSIVDAPGGKRGFGVRQYEAAASAAAAAWDETAFAEAVKKSVPEQPVVRQDARTPEARLAFISESGFIAAAQPRLVALQAKVDELNVIVARIALAGSALMVCSSARVALFQSFPELKA